RIGVCASDVLGVEETDRSGFAFFPNPARDRIRFSADVPVDRIQILSVTGQVLSDTEVHQTRGELDLTGLRRGVYLLRVQIDGKTGIYRLIKQ
ncbi:MAG: T9SS type A sorting domain-containing protein, partial [Chlorobi bacterium]|nr:T9SS type A sorting domain-containing protein [Chlorobiota bacterium]